ncbi:MAG: glycosyltransferase family 2 protein [Candidatus Edwardsbacteria bacterium]
MTNFVSIILPIRNEAKHIEACINSIFAQDFSKDQYEILAVDGVSDDGTREILENLKIKYQSLKIIDNPMKIVTAGLNLGIKNAKGDIIVRMDAHAKYGDDYLKSCLEVLTKSGAANVGGHMRALPANNSAISEAIMLAHYIPFGLGGGRFHNPDYEGYVETVWLGCFKKEVFDKMGYFDERFTRTEDIDFNSRLRIAGYKIYLSPKIKAYYYCRPNLKELWRQRWLDGMGVVRTLPINPRAPKLRHFVPLLFVGSLLLLAMVIGISGQDSGGRVHGLAQGFLIFELLTYLLASLFFTIKMFLSRRAQKPQFPNFQTSQLPNFAISGEALNPKWKLFFCLPLVFATLHLSYGLGSLWGLLTLPVWWARFRMKIGN